jgi:hypothetical protein
MGWWLRRVLSAAVIVVAGSVAAVHPEAIRNFYLDVYPSDPGKREALELCFLQDHKFNRLDAEERDTCYKHALVPTATDAAVGIVPADQPQPNEVDLRRDAAAGSMPRNDVRRHEETQNALHMPQ